MVVGGGEADRRNQTTLNMRVYYEEVEVGGANVASVVFLVYLVVISINEAPLLVC